MKNISDTSAYSVFDHIFSQTLRSLSHVVGVRKITKPFWNRWLASGVADHVIYRFLDNVRTIDGWATVALDVVDDEVAAFKARRAGLSDAATVQALRELSYICNMAQWGCLPITEARKSLYRQCRDFYIEAETLAFGDLYQRLEVAFQGHTLFANLHRQADADAPLVVIVHGIDGCKEEHLATELALVEAGLSVLCLDGPGQAEALLLDDILWSADFHLAVSAALDRVAASKLADASRTGVLGISIGGMWSLRAAADDPRIKAVFDLGGPIHTRAFPKLPFLIKTRMCQVTGARDASSITQVLARNSIEDEGILRRIKASVRMLHGGRDRVVGVPDKQWLLQALRDHDPGRYASLRIIEDGDHCCTGHAGTVREDAVAFFKAELLADPARAPRVAPMPAP